MQGDHEDDLHQSNESLFQLLQPSVEQFIHNESKVHLALTHVISSLKSSISSLQEIVNILNTRKEKGNENEYKIAILINVSDTFKESFNNILNHYTSVSSTLSCLERYV